MGGVLGAESRVGDTKHPCFAEGGQALKKSGRGGEGGEREENEKGKKGVEIAECLNYIGKNFCGEGQPSP